MDEFLYIGVDPGKTGAMAVLDEKGEFFELIDYNAVKIYDFFVSFAHPCVAYLEHVHSMPGQGVVSTFSFGENFGWWKGFFDGFEIPFTLIDPKSWQKKFSLHKTEDCAKPSLTFAREMFPEADLHLKKHHNRADALLIARACWLDYHKGAKHGDS